MIKTIKNRRTVTLGSAGKLKLGLLCLLFIMLGFSQIAESAVNITNYSSNLTATFQFVPFVGVTNNVNGIVITPDVITTNYDFAVANSNNGTNQMEFGQTNYFALSISNIGGENSLSDYLFLSLSLLNTNESGYVIQTYYDANTNGVYDFGDSPTNNIGLLPRNHFFPLLVKVGCPDSASNENVITARVVTSATSYLHPGNNGLKTNDVIIKMNKRKASYFQITHNGVSLVSNYTPVVITPMDASSNAIAAYKGRMVIGVVSGTLPQLSWSNGSGVGAFTNAQPSQGSSVYYHEYSDVSSVTLYLKNNVVESNLIFVSCEGVSNTATNYLMFDRLEPYVASMVPVSGGYATLNEIQNIALNFNKPLDWVTVTSANIQVFQYLKSGTKTNCSISIASNGSRKSLNLGVSLVDLPNDILSKFEVFVSTNVTSSGFNLIPNPMNTTLYNAPCHGYIYSMIDTSVGGIVGQNLRGSVIPNDVSLIVNPNELPESAYIAVKNLDSSLVSDIKIANESADKNQFMEKINNYPVKEITGKGKTGVDLEKLNGLQLTLKYNDANNDGIVDGTGILEKDLNVFYLNPNTKKWEYVGKPTIDENSNSVSIKIYKYGKYSLLGDTTAKDFKESFIVYPNPFNPSSQTAKVRFYLDKDAYVSAEVYTLTGEKVKTLVTQKFLTGEQVYQDLVSWNGHNGRGSTVVNGIYIIKAKIDYTDGSGSKVKLWKTAVVK